ncbi:MAG: hypothetical protein LBV30_10660 [Propionibacteriaceae bacterium]|jgi:hypothetical protein|nr:hypothetical protein [Propionibacteriaceae bacterium]
MPTGWDWSQIIVIAIVVCLVWAAIQLSKAVVRVIMALLAVAVAAYLGQSMGWWQIFPFEALSPAQLWDMLWDWLKGRFGG